MTLLCFRFFCLILWREPAAFREDEVQDLFTETDEPFPDCDEAETPEDDADSEK